MFLFASEPGSLVGFVSAISIGLVALEYREIRSRFSHWKRRPEIMYRAAESAPLPTFAVVDPAFFSLAPPRVRLSCELWTATVNGVEYSSRSKTTLEAYLDLAEGGAAC
ncbi:MAG: hypothetical protein ACYC4U_10250 [Pirellulaceae bacterium]